MPADREKAFEMFTKAAEKGSILAQSMLSKHFAGVLDSRLGFHKAVILYKKAADNGDKNAQYNLAVSYLKGAGVQMDYIKAAVSACRCTCKGIEWRKISRVDFPVPGGRETANISNLSSIKS